MAAGDKFPLASIAKAGILGAICCGTFLGMLSLCLGGFVTFAPTDDWLSRVIGDEFAGIIWFTVMATAWGAVFGGCAAGCFAALAWLWDHRPKRATHNPLERKLDSAEGHG